MAWALQFDGVNDYTSIPTYNVGTSVDFDFTFVAKDSGGNARRNGDASLILNTLTWSIGDDVSITSWTNSELKGSN